MAQKLFHNFKASLASNDFCQWLLGILEPGVYRGFDNLANTGLNFTLDHTTTGIVQTPESLTPTNPIGVILTKQGIVIQEDATITGLSCASNAANGFARIDVVYMDHQDVNVIGGQAATYGVVQGPNGGPATPVLPNPNRQIKIGTITIPANAANLNAATFAREKAPLLGGYSITGPNFSDALSSIFAQLNAVNVFNAKQKWTKSGVNATLVANKLTTDDGGNTFLFNGNGTVKEITAIGEGAFIFLYKSGGGSLNFSLNQAPAAGGLKVRNTEFETAYSGTSIGIADGETTALIQRGSEFHFITPNNLWNVVASIYASIVALQAKPYTTIINIGDWNMDADVAVEVTHGLDATKIRGIEATILTDAAVTITPGGALSAVDRLPLNLTKNSDGTVYGGVLGFSATKIQLVRVTGGVFDATSFDATSYNRGFLKVTMVP